MSVAQSDAAESRSAQRNAELPPDQIAASEFPGAFAIPNSDAALKFGGLVRVNWVSTLNALEVDDRFITSAIPVEGTEGAAKGSRVNVIAKPSRFSFDLRTPTGVGHMRAFIEADFAGSNNTLRLRHAYGQWRRAIFGQTWSTFADPEAEPDGIDFEGLNAIVLFRQAQVRWSFAPAERLRLAFALEDPQPGPDRRRRRQRGARHRRSHAVGAEARRPPAGGGPLPPNPRGAARSTRTTSSARSAGARRSPAVCPRCCFVTATT